MLSAMLHFMPELLIMTSEQNGCLRAFFAASLGAHSEAIGYIFTVSSDSRTYNAAHAATGVFFFFVQLAQLIGHVTRVQLIQLQR